MKTIQKYVARDGSEFKTEEEAVNREILLDAVDNIYSILPTRPDGTDFSNGHGYIQHKESNLLKARAWLVELAEQYVFSQISEYDLRSYAFGRYLDDNNSVLYNLYHRIVLCVDENTFREYGQPYYANHPEDAKDA